jgi:hypothetical protein
MKKIITIFGITFFSSIHLYSQIGVGQLKKKANEVKENKKEKDSSEPKSSSTTKTGKANVEASPAAKSIREYRNALSFAQDAVKAKNNGAAERVAALEPMLQKIKADDPNWAEYAQDEEAYTKLKKEADDNKGTSNMEGTMEKLKSTISFLGEYSIQYTLDKAEELKRENYDAVVKYYDANPIKKTEYIKNSLSKIDKFYTVTLLEDKVKIVKMLDESMENTKTFAKENRIKSDYLSHIQSNNFDPKNDLAANKKDLDNCNKALMLLPNDKEISDRKAIISSRQTDLETYMSGGEYTKDVEKRLKMDVDEHLLSKVGMVNATLDGIAKRDFDVSRNGTIQRIVLASSDWKITKTNAGIPKSKSIRVETATKKDGKCWLVIGTIICEYEGGGVYGAPKYFSTAGQDQSPSAEMNCDNVMKNAK